MKLLHTVFKRMKISLEQDMDVIKDWRKALRSPPAYRVVNRTLRNQTYFVTWLFLTGFIVLIIWYLMSDERKIESNVYSSHYNYTYPLTTPIKVNGMHTFRIGIVADLDTNSKSFTEPFTWISYFKRGYLSYSPQKKSIVITWDKNEPVKLATSFALKDRGMELSELVVFNGKLLTFDDRTGMVYEIVKDKAIPWTLLIDGDGQTTKGFKSEWATVKNDELYVGSMGKEWTSASGVFVNNNPQYVKVISTKGEIEHVNWIKEYKRVREILDIQFPGYMIHESGVWSNVHRRWFFLPRRCSKLAYNETLDEHRGCSILISTDSQVFDVKLTNIPNTSSTRGFSSFKFVPTSQDTVIVALRTEELNGKTATYVTSFTIHGEVLLPDTLVSDLKYEGFEFI